MYTLQRFIDSPYAKAKQYIPEFGEVKYRKKSSRSHCLLETFVMMFTLFCAASAFNLLPVANRSKLFMCCFCSFGLDVFVKDSSKASKS